MANYFKILLMFVFVTAPVLDIAFLDNREATGHMSQEFQPGGHPEQGNSVDIDCICHVFHHGASFATGASHDFVASHFKAGPFENNIIRGLHPKPGLHPPTRLS